MRRARRRAPIKENTLDKKAYLAHIARPRTFGQYEDSMWRLPVTPKDIYIAAPITSQSDALKLAIKLMDAGFRVTSSWIREENPSKREIDNWEWKKACEYREMRGEMDIRDVLAADTLIILASEASTSGGLHVELGIAIGARKENIIVVGERPNVFFYSENVRFTANMDHLIAWLLLPDHGPSEQAAVIAIELEAGPEGKEVDDLSF